MNADGTWNQPGSSGFDIPPPPGAPLDRGVWDENVSTSPRPAAGRVRQRPNGMKFDAELDLSELDDRDRPGPTWSGRARELSRSHLIFRSRRMCYLGRRILVAVHLIDDRPVRLAGRVYLCEYDADGQYKIGIDLMPVPDLPQVQEWYHSH